MDVMYEEIQIRNLEEEIILKGEGNFCQIFNRNVNYY